MIVSENMPTILHISWDTVFWVKQSMDADYPHILVCFTQILN